MIPPRDLALVLLVVFAWGTNFSAMKIALEDLPPLLFVGLRFAILVPFLLAFARPAPWPAIIAVGLLINSGQFGFLFSAMRADVTAGLASLILQSQAPLTILLAGLFYKERVTPTQIAGIVLACAGSGAIGLASGENVTALGLALVLCGALSWALGNLVLRRLPGVNMLALFLWASLVPPPLMLVLSLVIEGPAPLTTVAQMSLQGWASVIYVAMISTVVGYSIWGWLLSRHPAALITPFALLIPVVGIVTAAFVLGERVTVTEALSGLVILAGISLTIIGRQPR